MSSGIDKTPGGPGGIWQSFKDKVLSRTTTLPPSLQRLSLVKTPTVMPKLRAPFSLFVTAAVVFQALKFMPVPVDRLVSFLGGTKTEKYGNTKLLQDSRTDFRHTGVDPSARLKVTPEVEQGIRSDAGTKGNYIKPGGRQYALGVLKPYEKSDSVGRIVSLGLKGAFTGNVPSLKPTGFESLNTGFNTVFSFLKPLQYTPEFMSGTIGFHYEDLTIENSPANQKHGNLLALPPTDDNLRKLATVETEFWHTHPGILARSGGKLLSAEQRFEFLKAARDGNEFNKA